MNSKQKISSAIQCAYKWTHFASNISMELNAIFIFISSIILIISNDLRFIHIFKNNKKNIQRLRDIHIDAMRILCEELFKKK